MLNKQLVNPKSIVIVGGSNNIHKPGGKIVKNIIDGGFSGRLSVVNPGEEKVQGLRSYKNISDIPKVDLAILAISAEHCLEAVSILAKEKRTKAFIIISAGFSETNANGGIIEKEIVKVVNSVNGCLVGPNCIGIINKQYKGVFTSPVPKFSPKGCDLISGSGATAVFILEAGTQLGVSFANVYSIGNASQTGAEDILEYMDLHFDPNKDSKVKLLYLETISNPKKLLKHASSLIKKGAKIAAIKAGSTAQGSRAAASHTGAIATSDMTIRALFKKAGIVYCSSREQLLSVASILTYKSIKGKNIALITHAGGSAVMLADVLSQGGFNIPEITGEDADTLKSFLNPGSSVSNPIDFLATGTAEQLGIIIDYCEHKFDFIDAMVVVFGSPGLFNVENVYNVLSVKLDVCKKPILPVLPSVVNAHKEILSFLEKGNINFPDEVVLGQALNQVYNTPFPVTEKVHLPKIDKKKIRSLIDHAPSGYLNSETVSLLVDATGILRAPEIIESSREKLLSKMQQVRFPVAMKVLGPLHKSEEKGVILNVASIEEVNKNIDTLIKIDKAVGIMVQPMFSGLELFIGVKKEKGFNHTILCGLGGIYIEILNDVSAGLSPIANKEARRMITSLRGYKLIKGARGEDGIDETQFAEIIQRVSALVEVAPEIIEMDINPLIGTKDKITAVDVRIKIEKENLETY